MKSQCSIKEEKFGGIIKDFDKSNNDMNQTNHGDLEDEYADEVVKCTLLTSNIK